MKAIIFDLDGTLQSLEMDFTALRKRLEEHFAPYGVAQIDGPLLEAVDTVSDRLLSGGMAPEMVAALKEKASELMDDAEMASYPKVRVLPGIPEMLSGLSDRMYRTAIMSRACRKYIDLSLRRLGSIFEVVLAREDVKRPKPDPEGVVFIMKKFGVDPAQTVVVGDHPFDIRAGKAAGTMAVGVLSGTSGKPALADAGADAVLECAGKNLLDWLAAH